MIVNLTGMNISNCINKANKAIVALRLLRKYFNFHKMRSLLDSYFYSVLYYNSVSNNSRVLLYLSSKLIVTILNVRSSVVYFEQGLDGAHAKRWSK